MTDPGLCSLRIEHVRKLFGSTCALEDVQLDIDAGEFVVLLGPSGCGKSTLLNVVAGVEPLSAGKLFIGGRDVTDLDPAERNVAMVFQSFALYPSMTARRNIEFALRMRRTPRAEIARRVSRTAALLQIEALLERRPSQLSGGQQQRVAIGRALVREPTVLLLDEPLSNLDAKLRAELRTEIKRLHESNRRTTLYVTHDQIEAMTLASRIAIMNQGRILQYDRPEALYRRPCDRFVASFIGAPTMRFFDGHLTAREGMVCLRNGSGISLPLPGLQCPAALLGGARVTLGLRAEQVRLADAAMPGTIPSHVLLTEPTGPDSYVSIAVGDHELTVRTSADCRLARQQPVCVLIDGAAVSLFDSVTGARLN